MEIFNPGIFTDPVMDWMVGVFITIFHAILIIVLALMITMRS